MALVGLKPRITFLISKCAAVGTSGNRGEGYAHVIPRGQGQGGSDIRDAQEPEPPVAALSEDHWKHRASAAEDGRCDLY